MFSQNKKEKGEEKITEKEMEKEEESREEKGKGKGGRRRTRSGRRGKRFSYLEFIDLLCAGSLYEEAQGLKYLWRCP